MNKRKILIIVVIFIALGCGFFLGKVNNTQILNSHAEPVLGIKENVTELEQSSGGEVENGTTTDQLDLLETTTDNNIASNKPTLTEGQRRLINAMGLDPDNFTITPDMIACAEAKMGMARVEEIKNGATPSISEGWGLYSCYK